MQTVFEPPNAISPGNERKRQSKRIYEPGRCGAELEG
jgi:hypothetical protein